MRVGTPGFVGGRLREGREARGFTSAQLAELLAVSRQVLSQYETGAITPRPDVMMRIPQVLNLPVGFFFRDEIQPSDAPLFWRSMQAATKQSRLRGERRQEWLAQVIGKVQEFVALPPVDIPELDLPADPLQLTDEVIESAASQLRSAWGLGAGIISNIVLLLENKGVIVARGELWSKHLDAFSRWNGDRPMMFLSSERDSASRSRFDAGHELAHLLLHKSVTRQMLATPAMFKLIEHQAHRFSSAFHLPAETFASMVVNPSLDSFLALKGKIRISVKAQIYRARELGLIEDASMYYRNYVRRGWNGKEPLDDMIEPEEPRLLRRAFTLLFESGLLSANELAAHFDFPIADLEALASLPEGFLTGNVQRIDLIDSGRLAIKKVLPPVGSQGGRVLNFPKQT